MPKKGESTGASKATKKKAAQAVKKKRVKKAATTKVVGAKSTPRRVTAAATGARLRVRQVRSGIGRAETYRRTLRALGLRHHQAVTTVTDTPSTRGMLHKVRHLVQVTPEEG